MDHRQDLQALADLLVALVHARGRQIHLAHRVVRLHQAGLYGSNANRSIDVLKYGILLAVSSLITFISGVLLAFFLTHYQRIGMKNVQISSQSIAGKDALIVSAQEHPPWAHSHFYSVDINHEARTIKIAEYYMIWNPLSERILDRLPIVISEGLLEGHYTIKCWDGDVEQVLGDVTVGPETKLKFNVKRVAGRRTEKRDITNTVRHEICAVKIG